jgi:hypothetical protein
MPASPSLSVILPLVDVRGAAEAAIHSWRAQRSAENPFEIVVVENGHRPALLQRVRALLDAEDQVVPCRSINEAVLYNAGAKAARGEVFVFSEAHVLAKPGCVDAIRDSFDKREVDVGCLASTHHTRTLLAELDARLGEQEASALQALGTWRQVGLRGFAIRAELFRAFGGFEESYNRFAETVLAVRLDAAGCRIDYLEEAIIDHVDTDSFLHLQSALVGGAIGECAWWEAEPEVARRYFGANPPWREEGTPPPHLALRMMRDLWRVLRHDRTRSGWRSQLHAAVRLLPQLVKSALLGRRASVLVARMFATLAGWRLLRCLAPLHRLPDGACPELIERYLVVRKAYVRCGVREYLASRNESSLSLDHGKCPSIPLTSLDEASLVGFFPPESWQEQSYRWSGPIGVLVLPLEARCHRFRIDIRPTGTWSVRHPRLFFNGQPLPPESILEKDGHLIFEVPGSMFDTRGKQRLTFTCEPFVPARHGLSDPRHLGVAVIALQVEALAEVEGQGQEARAA